MTQRTLLAAIFLAVFSLFCLPAFAADDDSNGAKAQPAAEQGDDAAANDEKTAEKAADKKSDEKATEKSAKSSAKKAEPIAAPATVKISSSQSKEISPDLFGIFFEDINYAADGGLYAELVQNRSFEYSEKDTRNRRREDKWNSLTAWSLVALGEGKGKLAVDKSEPIHANNPHYAVVTVEKAGEGVGMANSGFDGVPVVLAERYDLSFFARQTAGAAAPVVVRLVAKSGNVIAEAKFPALTNKWQKYTAVLSVLADSADAKLVVLANGEGTYDFDVVSLFPQRTFKNHANGLRADLAQTIAAIKPKFVRFPGGCLAHGYGLENIYCWKDTIGPIEQRKEQFNIWNYHQTVGLGYFEYFQFCEDIDATPLPVLAAGVCCQNSPGGQHCIPMKDMPAYVQDVLDLVEYANGPETSTWGAKRAAAGHPKPFNLKYLGIGNEDLQSEGFRERFEMIMKAVQAKYPDIIVVGTVGPFSSGEDFDLGWKFANKLNIPMVDEHYYNAPDWFLANLNRYDSYDRSRSKVYLGEYASKGNTLYNALAEAAYMTALERNGDVVRLASYAPLLGKDRHTQWNPNLIYFTNDVVVPTVNYYVQKLFGQNAGQTYLPTEVTYTAAERTANKAGVFLGAWNTEVEYKDLVVTVGDKKVVDEQLDKEAKNWKATSGKWETKDGVYRQTSNAAPAVSVCKTQFEAKKYVVTVKAKKTGGAEGFLIGFGPVDGGDDYWWNVGGWGNVSSAVQKGNGPQNRGVIGEQVKCKVEKEKWYDVKIEVDGRKIKCYLDDKLIQEIVDQSGDVFAASTVKDKETGDVIVKIVNVSPVRAAAEIELDLADFNPKATKTVMSGDPKALNTFPTPLTVEPKTSSITVDKKFKYSAPPYSFTVIRISPKKAEK